jgi:hypothetical protein
LAVGAIGGFSFSGGRSAPATSAQEGLSQTTREILSGLRGNLEIRFYSILDRPSLPDSITSLAERAQQLLAGYQQEGNGKVVVRIITSAADLGGKTASSDGIVPFNLDKGTACFLGVALEYGGLKESLPNLTPDWEPALESDLSRAIQRLALAAKATMPAPASAPVDPAAVEAVQRLVPNLPAVSLEEAQQVLRQAALDEFRQAAQAMENQVKEARERLSRLQQGGDSAELGAALRQLQQLQAEQTEHLKGIAAASDARMKALEQLKRQGQ